MRKLYALLLLLLAASGLQAASLFPHAVKARHTSPFQQRDLLAPRHKALPRRLLAPAQPLTIPCGDQYGYLNGPSQEVWFYTVEMTTHEVVVPGGYGQTESYPTGYTVRVYDEAFRSVGTVQDTIALPDSATAVAQVMIDPTVTKKFFNIDENYELIVSLVYNYADYSLAYESRAYTIAPEGQPQRLVAQLPGYCVDAVNAAQDSWSENFFLTFLTEESLPLSEASVDLNTYLASCKHVLTTYKKAGWSDAPAVISEIKIGQGNTPGSENNVPFFASTARGGRAYFFTQEYEKWFFTDPTGMSGDESATPDNRLLIHVYSATPSASAFTLEQTTAIAMAQPASEGTLYNFYGVGELAGTDDFLPEGSSWGFLVCVEGYQTGTDECLNSYYLYTPEGELRTTLSENTYSATMLSDIPGQPRQALFITTDENGTDHTFHFIDLAHDAQGRVVAEPASDIPQTTQGVELSGYLDRTPHRDSYLYCAQLNGATADAELNTYDPVGWFQADGTLSHVDHNNLGPRIAMAQAYISGTALSPYTFDTDADHEYMYLVKRYTGDATSSVTQEELLVVGPDGERLLTLTPQDDKGNLQLITLLQGAGGGRLLTSYNKNYHYTAEVRDLPLESFRQGGDGTADSPLLIATAGDLMLLSQRPDAHYRLTADIDADAMTLPTVKKTFTGTLDGDGHILRNITLAGPLLDEMQQGASVGRLRMAGVKATGDCQALIAGTMTAATLHDIHIYNVEADIQGPDAEFATLAHDLSLGSAITGCSVLAADLRVNGSAAGLAHTLRTGSTVAASAFQGTIAGETTVGGIVAATVTGDETVADCHATADLTAKNTVGGIVALSRRTHITRCTAEGTLHATANTQAWADNGPMAGGIVGYLEPTYDDKDTTIVLDDCFAALDTLTGYTPLAAPDYATQHQTLHRIAGYTRPNAEPDITSYDADWEPVYGEPNAAETALRNNWAWSRLAPVENLVSPDANTVYPDATSTEGCTLPEETARREWFATVLHFPYGTTAAAPWDNQRAALPALYHELPALLSADTVRVEAGDTFLITVDVATRQPLTEAQLAQTVQPLSTHPDVASATGEHTCFRAAMTLQFAAHDAGEADITLLPGATFHVTVAPRPYDAILTPTLTPQGDTRAYDLQGRPVARPLHKGLYIIGGRKVIVR